MDYGFFAGDDIMRVARDSALQRIAETTHGFNADEDQTSSELIMDGFKRLLEIKGIIAMLEALDRNVRGEEQKNDSDS